MPKKPNPNGGQPCKCTTRLIKKIVPKLLAGNYIEVAAASVGIAKTTLYLWLKLGAERPRSIYRKFSDAVFEAQAVFEANALANIERAAKGTQHALLLKDENGNQLFDQHGLPVYIKPQAPDWQAEAWRLERKFSQRWSKLERQEVTTNAQPLVQITLPSNQRELRDGVTTSPIATPKTPSTLALTSASEPSKSDDTTE